ncbi:hypothetical protein tb265_43410 [Gemmatimonadetes bacterium T265]|nr:hypothetical protein tb265_43410 [Gemmatimonadetes bacterium T265]
MTSALPSDPVRVFLDISYLARAQAGPRRSSMRAGIYRVIEQSIRALAAEPAVRLTLGTEVYHASALAYVGGDPALRGVEFPVSARALLGSRLYDRTAELHLRTGASATGALPMRLANRVVGDVNRALDTVSRASGRGALARADVFHSPFNALPPRGARARRVRYFLTVLDLIPVIYPEFGGVEWMREILESIGPDDHVLTISEHTRRDFLDAFPGFAPERVSVTYLAADPARFRPCRDAAHIAAVRARYGIPDAPYVLTVGTMFPHKNLPRLVRAFAEAVRAERIADLRLVLTGAREYGHAELRAEIGRQRDVRDRILFAGYVDDEDLAPLYSGALAFAFPSYYEGFGLPPLEAMQCGTPVITSNTSSLPEVVGDAGLMVDPRDTDALAQAIADVYRDPARRADLAARALARAERFTWARYAEATVAAYRSAL